MDSTAFLYEPIDELFAHDQDVVLGIMEPEQVHWGQSDYPVFTNGIVVLSDNKRAREAFLTAWLEEWAPAAGRPQDVLVRLLTQHTHAVFCPHATATVIFNHTPVRMWIVSAALYSNHTLAHQEEWADAKIPYAKIYHLPKAAQNKAILQEILLRLETVRLSQASH